MCVAYMIGQYILSYCRIGQYMKDVYILGNEFLNCLSGKIFIRCAFLLILRVISPREIF